MRLSVIFISDSELLLTKDCLSFVLNLYKHQSTDVTMFCPPVCVKCLCASRRWELLWRLCKEFQSESEQQAGLESEQEDREGQGEGGWKVMEH